MDRFEKPNNRNSPLTFPKDFRADPSDGVRIRRFPLWVFASKHRPNDAPGTHNGGTRTGRARATRRRRAENRERTTTAPQGEHLLTDWARSTERTANRSTTDGDDSTADVVIRCYDYGRVSRRTSAAPDRARYALQHAHRCRFAFGVDDFEAKTIYLFLPNSKRLMNYTSRKPFMSFLLLLGSSSRPY